MSDNDTTFYISRYWDGAPAEDREHATLIIRADGDHLHLHVDAPFHGDPPPTGPAGPRWRLWEHEVVELFIAGPDQRYTEVELGPHGHHLVLRLQGLRNPVQRELPLTYEASVEGARWTGTATLPRSYLPLGPHTANAYAIHGQGPDRTYLACYPVPGEIPDFHRLECFAPIALD
jgi:hypothetical protein